MSFLEHDRKTFIADAADDFAHRRISKRDFIRKMSIAGLGLSTRAASMLGRSLPFAGVSAAALAANEAQTPPAVQKWLKEVGGKFKGTKIRYSTEATAPSIVANQITKEEFTSLTGIEVEVEIVPLEQVLQKATLDSQGKLGTYDLYYLDQSWTANFIEDTFDPRELYKEKPELAMPDFDWDDFSKPLVQGISMHGNRMIGIPFDIPIFIMMYRKDIFAKHGLKVPTTMDEYLATVRAITKAESKIGMMGTTGELKSGHYSLNCDWTAWLWAHGGSVFDKAGNFSGGDAQGMAGLEYMLELVKNMPPAAKTWTWDGQGQSLGQGQAAMSLIWGDFLPSFDAKDSKVFGLIEPAHPPKEKKLRSPSNAGFGEIPHIGHQGGSSICVSRYAKNKDAAWIFAQWVTSKDVVARSSILGGGASPIRKSAFADPRVRAMSKPGPGTTRHLDVVQWTIDNAMGTEPHMPTWVEISNNVIPIELGKLLAGQHKGPKECMDAIKKQADELAKPFRPA